jgi:hypothetical protein
MLMEDVRNMVEQEVQVMIVPHQWEHMQEVVLCMGEGQVV